MEPKHTNDLFGASKGHYLTAKAEKALELAQLEAEKLGVPVAGTHHIILGLLMEGTSLANMALRRAGIVLDKVDLQDPIWSRSSEPYSNFQEDFLEEAAALQHRYVGTEHLLLALAKDSRQTDASLFILTTFGANMNSVRATVLRLLGEPYKHVGKPY